MAATSISAANKLATGINVFTLPRARHAELIDTLSAINAEIVRNKFPMNVSASFHRAIDAPIVVNYNQYTDRSLGQFLRTQPTTAPLLKRTHELSEKHEIHWYEVAEVITASGANDRLEISAAPGRPAVIAVIAASAGKADEMLALLKAYGAALRDARTPGFVGIALHRGYEPGHVSAYEQWESVEAYRAAARNEAAAEPLGAVAAAAVSNARDLYAVVSVTRFK